MLTWATLASSHGHITQARYKMPFPGTISVRGFGELFAMLSTSTALSSFSSEPLSTKHTLQPQLLQLKGLWTGTTHTAASRAKEATRSRRQTWGALVPFFRNKDHTGFFFLLPPFPSHTPGEKKAIMKESAHNLRCRGRQKAPNCSSVPYRHGERAKYRKRFMPFK